MCACQANYTNSRIISPGVIGTAIFAPTNDSQVGQITFYLLPVPMLMAMGENFNDKLETTKPPYQSNLRP